MKVNIDAAMVPSTVCAVSGWKSACQPITSSILCRSHTTPSVATAPSTGRIQMESLA
jgi:hypothetical protein